MQVPGKWLIFTEYGYGVRLVRVQKSTRINDFIVDYEQYYWQSYTYVEIMSVSRSSLQTILKRTL